MVNAQEWLDREYPKEGRSKVIELNIAWTKKRGGKNKLEGSLDLKGFVNLEELNCSGNMIKWIDLGSCFKLTVIICSGNWLEDTSFLNKLPNPKKLEKLDISNNWFNKRIKNDLSMLSLTFLERFTNLKHLDISNRDRGKSYNHFWGSLEPLQFLTKLEMLDISETDISGGLEYLPLDNLERFRYCADRRSKARVKDFKKVLGKSSWGGNLTSRARNVLWEDYQHQSFDDYSYEQKTSDFKSFIIEHKELEDKKYTTQVWINELSELGGDMRSKLKIRKETSQDELMTNWTSIHSEFTEELEKRWKNKEFSYEECKQWISIGLEPADIDFIEWLRRWGYTAREILNNNELEKLSQQWWEEFQAEQEKKWDETQSEQIDPNNWGNISLDFTNELIQSWQNLNFTYQQTQDWINTGFRPTDYNFCAWLRDELQLEPEEVLNNMNTEDNYQEADLKEQFQEYQSQIEIPPK